MVAENILGGWYLKLGAIFDKSGFNAMNQAIKDMGGLTSKVFGVFQEVANKNAEIARTAKFYEMKPETLQKWQRFGEITTGNADAGEEFAKNMAMLQTKLGQGKFDAAPLAQLGIAPDQIKDADSLLSAIAVRFDQLGNNPALRKGLKQNLLDAGVGLSEGIINAASDGSAMLKKKMDSIPTGMMSGGTEFFEKMTRLQWTFNGFVQQLMNQLAPTFNEIIAALTKLMQSGALKEAVKSVFGMLKDLIEWLAKPENIKGLVDTVKSLAHAVQIIAAGVGKLSSLFGGGEESEEEKKAHPAKSAFKAALSKSNPLSAISSYNKFALSAIGSGLEWAAKKTGGYQENKAPVVHNTTYNISGVTSPEALKKSINQDKKISNKQQIKSGQESLVK
jgi:hypothetical protein